MWVSRDLPRAPGYIDPRGHLRVNVHRQPMLAHRVAWAIHTGEAPPEQIDHKNLVPDDMRWDNLRPATRFQNQQNRPLNRNNTTGFKGVTRFKSKFLAKIEANGIKHRLGLFTTPEEASAAYVVAARRLHGEFANAGSTPLSRPR